MKKKVIPLILLLTMILTMTASARVPMAEPYLSFSGTTAYCQGYVKSQGDDISITLELLQGTKLIDSWSKSGTGQVLLEKTCKVEKGKTYTLELHTTINGEPAPTQRVSGTCR